MECVADGAGWMLRKGRKIRRSDDSFIMKTSAWNYEAEERGMSFANWEEMVMHAGKIESSGASKHSSLRKKSFGTRALPDPAHCGIVSADC